MEKGKITLHAGAVNLARRYTEMNENDLVMESLFEEGNLFPKKTYTKQDCAELAQHLMHESNLPAQCKKYDEVVSNLRRRDSDTTHPTQYLS